MEGVVTHSRHWNHDKSHKPETYLVVLYYIEDISRTLLGYNNSRWFSEDKWNKEWI